VMDCLLQARDEHLFTAVTDCGAGGLSSACGEMAAEHGARIHLDRIPVKYAGLSCTEVWISESQERMVVAVAPKDVPRVNAIFAAEDVDCTDLGEVTDTGRLELLWHGTLMGDLAMAFLHDGVPRSKRPAVFTAPVQSDAVLPAVSDCTDLLTRMLARPNISSKEWVIRQYDHEVQAGSIIKPLVGVTHDGPSDAAVVAPIPGNDRGVAISCGLNNRVSDVDAYWATAMNIEEALRNLVCVGAPISQVAILDNFSWAKCTDPAVFGALVRACEACYDFAMYYGTPFVSGKDSLSNEFTFEGKVIKIPHTLLITAMTVVPDVKQSLTMDLKRIGDVVIMVGLTRNELGCSEYLDLLGVSGGLIPTVDRALSKPVLDAVAACTAAGLVNAAHDVSEGGLGVSLAEMAFAGGLGLVVDASLVPRQDISTLDRLLFSESASRIVITVPPGKVAAAQALLAKVPHAVIGDVVASPTVTISGLGGTVVADNAVLKASWQRYLAVMAG